MSAVSAQSSAPRPADAPPVAPAVGVGWHVRVSFRQRPVQSRWADFEWETAAVEAADEGDALRIELHPSEGEGYWLNLNSPAPCIFVMWRMEEGESSPTAVVVTVSYNEAGRMLDAGEHVDNVPMPDALREQLADYTAAHYRPEPRRKVRRNDPFSGAFLRDAHGGLERG